MTPHGVGVVERREVDSAAAVPVCSGCEGASDVGGQRASIEEGGEVVRGERVIAGEQEHGSLLLLAEEASAFAEVDYSGGDAVGSDKVRTCSQGRNGECSFST